MVPIPAANGDGPGEDATFLDTKAPPVAERGFVSMGTGAVKTGSAPAPTCGANHRKDRAHDNERCGL